MSVVELLDRCRALGVKLAAGPTGALEWEAVTDPPAELLVDLGAHKAELLAALNVDAEAQALAPPPGQADTLDGPPNIAALPADPAALQAQLDELMADAAWASGWSERLKATRGADLATVKRTAADMVALAIARYAVGDGAGFRGWCRHVLAHIRGEHWDRAARRPVTWPPDLEIITSQDAADTFADAEAVRQRHRRTGRCP
jgi:hypothetical protein